MHLSASHWLSAYVVPFLCFVWSCILIAGYQKGWGLLVRSYPDRWAFAGRRRSFQTAGVGTLGFQNSLQIGSDPTGLYLRALGLFPPVMIPWADISVAPEEDRPASRLGFHFQRAPSAVLTVGETLGRELLLARPLTLSG